MGVRKWNIPISFGFIQQRHNKNKSLGISAVVGMCSTTFSPNDRKHMRKQENLPPDFSKTNNSPY